MTGVNQLAAASGVLTFIVLFAGVLYVAFRAAGNKARQENAEGSIVSLTSEITALNSALARQAAEIKTQAAQIEGLQNENQVLRGLALRDDKLAGMEKVLREIKELMVNDRA